MIRLSFALRLLALSCWTTALAYLSLAPEVSAPGGFTLWDKFNHFAAYALLAVLLIRVLDGRLRLTMKLLACAWFICFGYGLLLESLQWMMALGRQWEVGDLLANGLGSLVGCAIFCLKLEG